MENNITVTQFEVEKQRFELEQRKAKAYATSMMIPQHLRDTGSMMILNQLSRDLSLPMLTLAQQIFMVKGKVGMSGQLVITMINKSESVDHGMRWEIENEGTPKWRVRAWNSIDGEKIFGEWLSDADVTMFGWKSNPLWKTMPIRMAKYRTATYWGRDYAPDVLMGLSDKEEIIDVTVSEPERASEAETLNNVVSQSREVVIEVTDDPQDIKTAVMDEEAEEKARVRDLLKEEADSLGVKYAGNISYETLAKRVEAFKVEDNAGGIFDAE